MFELQKIFLFEAGHVLKGHDGKCKGPHGHSYALTIHIRSKTLKNDGPKMNMVIDFSDISSLVKPMIETYFDHKWLNDSLECDSVTVEYMAKWIFDYLDPYLPGLSAITLNETATSKVVYSRE